MIYINSYETDEYLVATYYLKCSRTLSDGAWDLAIGQSVGNPNVRNRWETDELFEKYSCKIIGKKEDLERLSEGTVRIAFPVVNTDWEEDGISHLLCQLMGGQMDIDIIQKCHLLHIDIPKWVEDKYFMKPKHGIDGVRKYTNTYDKPLLGGIIKPKTGITPDILLKMVKELVEGGVNFIKEDEILSNPSFCRIDERVPLIMNYLASREMLGYNHVVYAVCINADSPYLLERVKRVYELGGNGVHVNFWCGMGSYRAIRKLTETFERPFFIHFQKSGDKILTEKRHDYHIDWKVVCKLAGLSGVDFIHAGMWGGYMSDDENELKNVMGVLHEHNVIPALSCGMHPGIVNAVTKRFGIDYMANCGGSLHGHPGGTLKGAMAMRQAIDGQLEGSEYMLAVEKWGKTE